MKVVESWRSMISLCLWALWAAVAFAVYTYLGYPLLLLLLVVVRRRRPPVPPLAEWPSITIVLPVHNEEGVIQDTLENLLQLDYPADRRQIVVVSDASTDKTDGIIARYASRGVELLRMSVREGKTAAENVALPLLRGEIIVNTDASVHVERGALKRLIATFADPTVGVASSHNVSLARSQVHANYAEAWYVGYDMWVRGLESRVSGIVGAAGCLYAVRAPIQMHLLPDALSRDFAAVLVARERGLRAVSVRDAVCFVPRIPSLRREYRRKVRTITRGMSTLYFKRRLLNPFRYGVFSWILASHKGCRWLVPPIGVLALIAAARVAGSVSWGQWGLGVAAFAGLCAALAWWWPERWRLTRILAVPAYLVIGNLAALQAAIAALRGARTPVWEPTRRPAVRPAGSVADRPLPGPTSPHDDGQGADDDLEVFEDRLACDVFEVERQLSLNVGDRTVVLLVDLGPAGDPRPHPLALPVALDLLAQTGEDCGLLRAGAYHVHVTAQHVDQLGQLV